MSSSPQRLDQLRGEIDAIDTALHDLVVKRATIVEEIRKIKHRSGPALRPGREASILRRLAARHQGAFPLKALICVWREMISTFTQMQDPFSAAVVAPRGHGALLSLARDHYGSGTPLSPVPNASAAVRAVADGAANVAVLPLPPELDQGESWWPLLMGNDDKTPRVITRLPFAYDGKGDQALVVGIGGRDSSGEEATLVAIEMGERISRGKAASESATAGFDGAVSLASSEMSSDRTFHLVEVPEDVTNDDPRLGALALRLGPNFVRAFVIGGYARQLPVKEG